MRVISRTLFVVFLLMFTISCKENPANNTLTGEYNPDDYKDEANPEYEPEEDTWLNEARDLTQDFTEFPTSDGMNRYIENATGPPNNPCPDGMIPDTWDNSAGPTGKELSPAAVGARRVLASYYQSCKAIDVTLDSSTPNLKGVAKAKSFGSQKGISGGYLRKITDTNAFVNSHAVLKRLKGDSSYPGKSCKDMTKMPPVYGYGSRAYPNKSGTVKIFKKGGGVANGSQPAAGIDCSAFISMALGAQGLKVNKSSGPFTDNTTRSYHSQINRSGSCLKKATMTPEAPVKSGDIINVAGSHIVMIDSVGEDPLGIEKAAAAGNCNSITPKKFNFTYIHSGSIKGSYGPSRVKANLHSGGSMWNNLRVMAVKMCQNKIKNDSSPVNSGSIRGVASKFTITRHQTSDPKCVSDKRIKIEGEECINKCNNLSMDEKYEEES